jgi:hypothetical protein
MFLPMSDSINLSLDDDNRVAGPPLVDSLHYERDADEFSIIFVPSVGEDPTRSVFVPRDSAEGRLIATYLYRIRQLIGDRVERIVHGGGGNYTLRLATSQTLRLSDERPNESWAPEVSDRLKQIAEAAEAAFNISHAGRR